jgi:ABC-2 type transport system ATP-binding protein
VEEACDRAAILRAGEIVHVQSMPELATRHRIKLSVAGPLPSIPGEFDPIPLPTDGPHSLAFETSVELNRVLPWLATLSPDDVRVEPVGLHTVYERFHQRKSATSGAGAAATAASGEAVDLAQSGAS